MWLEAWYVRHNFHGRYWLYSASTVGFGLLYIIWVIVAEVFNGVYPYAFLNTLPVGGFIAAIIAILAFYWSLYWLGFWYTNKRHPVFDRSANIPIEGARV
jgi:hypothetical protein